MTMECKPNTRHIIWPVHDTDATYRNWALRVRDWINWIYDADDRQESQEHLDMLPYWLCNEVREECDYTADPAVFMQFRIV